MRAQTPHLDILGGGISGLAAGCYARARGLPFRVIEAGGAVGGHCRTIEHRGFRFDTGAHRLHDRSPDVTREINDLLGADLKMIDLPSRIFHRGRYIEFPLSPINLMQNLGLRTSAWAAFDLLRARATPPPRRSNFESLTVRRYGRTIAENFLLNYSQKLWGIPCDQLSPEIAGARLQGLTLVSLLIELVLGQRAKTRHLEGASYYYPRLGIGMITERMAERCGRAHVRVNARVTAIHHHRGRIQAIEVNGDELLEVAGDVVSTLPIGPLVQLLRPRVPDELLVAARGLRHRDLRLAVFLLDRPSVIANAGTVYCPGAEFSLTRWYEPRNRSPEMSPAGKTSLVAEVPCQRDDALGQLSDDQFLRRILAQLVQAGWFHEREIIDTSAQWMEQAYPVIDLESEALKLRLMAGLEAFTNLRVTGRNGLFGYFSMHHAIDASRRLVEAYP